jgi:hypothetical protein
MPAPRTVLSKQAIEAQNRSGKLVVSGRLKSAIDRMVWNGDHRGAAATHAGMTDHGVREALRKPHVKAYYREQLEMLRLSERPRNIHRLAEIRDAANNMPAVNAIKLLEQIDDDAPAAGRQTVPGLVIYVAATEAQPVTIDVTPTAHDVPNGDVEDSE